MSTPDILPNCRLKDPKKTVFRAGVPWVPIYCANCGADGGLVPEDSYDFAFYLCNPCFETHGTVTGTMVMPDEVFWEKIKNAQLEKFGRELSAIEASEALKDDNHILSKLVKDRTNHS